MEPIIRLRCLNNNVLADWFSRKNIDDTIIFIQYLFTVPFQVRSITDKNIPLKSGSVIYERTKLTGAQYKHRVIFTKDGHITHGSREQECQLLLGKSKMVVRSAENKVL